MLTATKPELKQFLNKLNQVDFGPTAYKLIYPGDGEGLTIEQATAAIEKYRHFLVLVYLYPDRTIIPSKMVDFVWHQCILFTMKYEKDCMEVFGYFVHHDPFGITDNADGQTLETAFAETCQLMEHHFG